MHLHLTQILPLTAVSGRISVYNYKFEGDHVIISGYNYSLSCKVVLEPLNKNPLLDDISISTTTNTIFINGVESLSSVLSDGLLTRAKEMVALTPLLPKTITVYILAAFPKYKIDHHEVAQILRCPRLMMNNVGLNMDSAWSDGEAAYRNYQQNSVFNFLPDNFEIFNDLDVKLDTLFRSSMEYSSQDPLHTLKKLRNNMRYLSNQVLSLKNLHDCDPMDIDDIEHITVRWDHIMEKWEQNQNFRLNSSRTAVNYIDKQDPALVTDICRYYEYFSGATRAYLMYMFLFIQCFWTSLGQRIYWIWRIKSFFKKWSDNVPTPLFFIASQTYTDLMSSCDGLIKYFMKMMNKNIPCTPWYLGTDLLEQIFGKGRFENYILYEIL